MFASLLSVVAIASYVAAQSSFQVNTPNTPIECVPTQISWTTGGTSPFTLLIQEPDANGTPVQIYSGLTGNSFSWSTNITSGTSIGVTVRDNNGVSAQSAAVTIGAGTSDSCLSASGATSVAAGTTSSAASQSSAASSAPASSATAPASSAASQSSAASSAASSASSAASHASSASSSASSASASASATGGSSAGMANTVAMGAVGFVGAVAAAILA